jgi:hypothetical protein
MAEYHRCSPSTPQTESNPRYRPSLVGSFARPKDAKLSPGHRRALIEGSAIAPEVLDASGAYTIERGRDLPEGFSERQRRRAPGILFPTYRPNGEAATIFRPDRVDPDNPGHKYEQPCKALGAPGNVLGVQPIQRHLIADTDVPVVFTEGTKKQLSLISATREAGVEVLVVCVVGVWNWMSDGKPIPDTEDIPLAGRTATVVFDSDVLEKVEVQEAAKRLAELLRERGARVHMTFFESKPDGSKCGADDFFAAGGTLEGLRGLTRPYDPSGADFKLVRLGRDERLAAMVADLRRRYEAMPAGKIGECSDRATMRELIRRAEDGGKVSEGGVVVHAPSRPLAKKTCMSQQAQAKSLQRLERDGYIEREEQPKRKVEKKGAAYLLKVSTDALDRALRCHYRREATQPNEMTSKESKESANREPHRYADMYAGDNAARASNQVPELRHSKVIHTWARKEGMRVVVDSEYVYRLAKQRQELVMYLLDNDGAAHEGELLERFGSRRTRLRDFRKRRIAPLEGFRSTRDKESGREIRLELGRPLVVVEDGVVRLLPEWREVLEEHRAQTGEHEDNRKQAKRYADQSKAYRNRDKTPAGEEGPLRGKEAIRRMVERVRAEEKERWIEEQRRKVGTTAATFLADELSGVIGARFSDVRERWRRQGGRVEDLRPAVLYGPYVFRREADQALYVYHDDGRERDDYDRMVAERSRGKKQGEHTDLTSDTNVSEVEESLSAFADKVEDKHASDWRDHPLSCECPRCTAPEPRYATPSEASAS